MKNFKQLLLAATLCVTSSATMALPLIDGNIGFAAIFGASVDVTPTSGNTTTATGIVFTDAPSGFNVTVNTAAGDFLAAGGASANFEDIDANGFVAPLTLWHFVIGAVNYSFDVTSVNIVSQNSSLFAINGLGIAKITGFEDTAASWSLSLDNNGGAFSFSSGANTNIAEPGIALLLGMGLIGIGAARKLRKQA